MLNKNNERELAYIVNIDAIEPIQGSDNCECAIVGGWHVMVRKNEFKAGDPAIYFEIDSYLDPSNPAFSFMEKKNYKVKTQRYTFGGKGNFISQGLLMSAANFGWTIEKDTQDSSGDVYFILDDRGEYHYSGGESRFLTKQLGVTYYIAEDNARKAASADKYKKMAQRNGKLFSHQPFRWLMKHTWGKKLLFVFFGRKRDKKTAWPNWVSKTDEERIENLPYLFKDKSEWIATEKIDGTSTTFTLKRGHRFKKDEFYVCSRNVVFDKPDKECFYDTNVYTEMAEKYHIYDKMKRFLNMNDAFADCDWITIQGETYGEGIQKRDYHMNEHNFMAFNFITSKDGRWNSVKMKDFLEKENGIPCVPILDEQYVLPDTLDELREYVDSKPSIVDGDLREGIVFRSQDGTRSFKCVSPTFLLKFHQ